MFKILFIIDVLSLVFVFGRALPEGEVPCHVDVLPVFFVPKGTVGPTKQQRLKLTRHLKLAQKCYKQMLKDRDTFTIVKGPPPIVNGKFTLDHYKADDKCIQNVIVEIFGEFGLNRFNCPYILLVVIMSPREEFHGPRGRPFNGGLNGGGGLAIFTSRRLDHWRNIQGTIQHELGHGFGLPHVGSFGRDMQTSLSIMSRNKATMWSGFRPPKTRGILITEEIRLLSMNKKVFPNLYFNPEIDVPSGYRMSQKLAGIPKWDMPAWKPYVVDVRTSSGEMANSSVSNIVHRLIRTEKYRNNKSLIDLDPKSMWLSGIAKDGWVSVDVTFPVSVTLAKIGIHSRCGGKHHPVKAVRIQAKVGGGFANVCNEAISSPDACISFTEHTAEKWRFFFSAGQSEQVVIRGLRFFSPKCEIFSPDYVYVTLDK